MSDTFVAADDFELLIIAAAFTPRVVPVRRRDALQHEPAEVAREGGDPALLLLGWPRWHRRRIASAVPGFPPPIAHPG